MKIFGEIHIGDVLPQTNGNQFTSFIPTPMQGKGCETKRPILEWDKTADL